MKLCQSEVKRKEPFNGIHDELSETSSFNPGL